MSDPTPDDPLQVVCLRVRGSENELIVPGSVFKTCWRCENQVWTSPATLASIRTVPHRFLCMECARVLSAQEGEETEIVPPSPEQLDEIRESFLEP